MAHVRSVAEVRAEQHFEDEQRQHHQANVEGAEEGGLGHAAAVKVLAHKDDDGEVGLEGAAQQQRREDRPPAEPARTRLQFQREQQTE